MPKGLGAEREGLGGTAGTGGPAPGGHLGSRAALRGMEGPREPGASSLAPPPSAVGRGEKGARGRTLGSGSGGRPVLGL